MRAVPLLLLAAVVVAGCAEAPEQQGARLAVKLYAGGGDTRCTSSPRLFFTAGPRAKVFVCIVKTGGTRCDRYIAYRSGRNYTVRLRERGADCMLPAG